MKGTFSFGQIVVHNGFMRCTLCHIGHQTVTRAVTKAHTPALVAFPGDMFWLKEHSSLMSSRDLLYP